MIHLYALTEGLAASPGPRGIDAAPVERLELDGVEALLSRVGSEPAPEEPALLAHASVVEWALTHSASVLPARFGQLFCDLGALEAALDSSRDELRHLLEQVRGCAELGVRVLGAPSLVHEPPASGRDYLRARLAEVSATERLAGSIHHTLAEGARESRRDETGTVGLVLSAVYLVPRDEVDRFRDRLQRLESDLPELGIVCTGPWPAYSFAAFGAESDVHA
jgi:hypothetical protein